MVTRLFSCRIPIYSCEHRASGIGSDFPFVNLPSSQSQPDYRVDAFPIRLSEQGTPDRKNCVAGEKLVSQALPKGTCPVLQPGVSGSKWEILSPPPVFLPDSPGFCLCCMQFMLAGWLLACRDLLCRPTVQTYCADLLCRHTVQTSCADPLCIPPVQTYCAEMLSSPYVPPGPTACLFEVSLSEALLG